MTDREKLIELIMASNSVSGFARSLAEYLIAHGVVLQRREKWAHLGGDEWCCTNCGEVITTEGSWETPTKKYCCGCGAKMDLEG